MAFKVEIENLRDRYNEDREQVLVPWTFPPIAGRIAWIRLLLSKIEEPMKIFNVNNLYLSNRLIFSSFQGMQRVISHPSAQPVIKLYNCLCKVFLKYESEHHSAWRAQTETNVKSLLKIPILKRKKKVLCVSIGVSEYIRI